MVLAVVTTLQVVSFTTAVDGYTIFGPALGADFPGFYNAGRILLDYPPAGLYDVSVQSQLYRELFPTAAAGESLPYAHAPFFALLVVPLALLPYPLAYALFLLVAPAVYACGLLIIRPALKDLDRDVMWTAALLALSFAPFLLEGWVGGQFAAFGFVWMAIALRCALSDKPFASGLALSMCFYKPTLLVLVLPMLLIGRQFRTLAGVTIGGLALSALSLLTAGIDGCTGYARMLLNYGGGADASEGFRTFKYVDVVSFFRLAMGDSVFADIFIAGAGCALFAIVARTWWEHSELDDDGRRLAWGTVLTLTPVLNLYSPIYDTLLPVLGLLLTADVLARRGTPMPDVL